MVQMVNHMLCIVYQNKTIHRFLCFFFFTIRKKKKTLGAVKRDRCATPSYILWQKKSHRLIFPCQEGTRDRPKSTTSKAGPLLSPGAGVGWERVCRTCRPYHLLSQNPAPKEAPRPSDTHRASKVMHDKGQSAPGGWEEQQWQEGMLSINQSPGEFESKDKDSGAAGNLGRLPEGGGLELGFEGGRDGTPLFSCHPSA